MKQPRILLSLMVAAVCGIALLPVGSSAQTLLSGTLTGVVRDQSGNLLPDVRVALREAQTGITSAAYTGADGRFFFRLLPPGEYELLAEKLEYRPHLLQAIPLRAGRRLDVDLAIAVAELPVVAIDSSAFRAAGVGWSRAGVSRWLGTLELRAPRDLDSAESLTSHATFSSDGFIVEGLPPGLSRITAPGIGLRPAMRPYGSQALHLPVAVAGLGAAELATHIPDVEWDGAAAGQLMVYPASGTRDFRGRAWGSGGHADFALGPFATPVATVFDVYRGGAEASGPLIADTAVFVVGAEWQRRTVVQPYVWRRDDAIGAAIAGTVRDSAGLAFTAFTLPTVTRFDQLSGWGRFDWQVADGHHLGVFAEVLATRSEQPGSGPARYGDYTPMDATHVLGGASLRSALGARVANEVRIGLATTAVDYDAEAGARDEPDIPSTRIVPGELFFGHDPAGPASLDRLSFNLEQSLLYFRGAHTFKVGFDAEWDSYDDVFEVESGGVFTFGGADGFASRAGSFTQRVGATPAATFSVFEIGAFLQDTWRPASGLEIVGGVRVMSERVLDAEPALNGSWLALTGLRNDRGAEPVLQLSPRLGFRWDVRDRSDWIVRGLFGIYHDDFAPEAIAEWTAQSGAVRVRRGTGDLDRWPVSPDSARAPVSGPLLTLLAGDFRPPRTTRASVGVSRISSTSLHLSASYRHTDFLPARRDLNRLTRASGFDQYGRPVFGELQQFEELVTVRPGTNRRFDAFDVVTALESTAFSDYWDVSVLVERRLTKALRAALSYTYSRTSDNWLAHTSRGTASGLPPLLGDSGSAESWAEGTSDFDMPHRLSLVTEVAIPLPLEPTLAVAYSLRSGLPFTPSFPAGVDVNGDYAENDPAFVDDMLPGMNAALDEWDCLRDQVGSFAERNSCRGDMVDMLDARFSLTLDSPLGSARVFAEGLNLLETELGRPDAALLRIDPAGQLEVDATSGAIRVPLMVNEGFGAPVRDAVSGRIFRFGLEVGL